MVSPPGSYGEKIIEEGFRWIPLQMERGSLNPLAELKTIWRIFQIYKSVNPDIVHHFTIKCVVYGGIAARFARIKGVVSAVTGLGYVFISPNSSIRLLRPLVCQLLKRAIGGSNRRLILQNSDDKQLFLSLNIIEKKNVHIIPGSGINTQVFNPSRKNEDIEGSLPKVVFAARLLWDKGVDEFVEAAKILWAAGIKAEFIIAGDPDPGNPAAIPDEVIKEWQLLPGVTFLGHVDEIVELFSNAYMAVLPSYREGLPRSLIEAAAIGCPIVTTDVPGCKDVVEHGVNGFIVPSRDSMALSEAIGQLLLDEKMAKKMGKMGRIKVLKEFDEVHVFERTMAVYSELIAGLTKLQKLII